MAAGGWLLARRTELRGAACGSAWPWPAWHQSRAVVNISAAMNGKRRGGQRGMFLSRADMRIPVKGGSGHSPNNVTGLPDKVACHEASILLRGISRSCYRATLIGPVLKCWMFVGKSAPMKAANWTTPSVTARGILNSTTSFPWPRILCTCRSTRLDSNPVRLTTQHSPR